MAAAVQAASPSAPSISGGVAADVALGGTGAGGGAGSSVNVGSTTQYTSGLIATAGKQFGRAGRAKHRRRRR
ncbi:MAG: hypothetical protein WDM77_21955 [Steroidobacteraceae bacterium]